jgi:thymidylate synthase ThyX
MIWILKAEDELEAIMAKSATFGLAKPELLNKLIYDPAFFEEEKKKLYKVWESHGTLMEFVKITLVFDDVSRNALDDLLRHRHTSPNVQSTRNRSIDLDKPILSEYYRQFFDLKKDFLDDMVIDKDIATKRDEKNGLLPLGIGSQAVITTNLRELVQIAGLRMCSNARKEIQDLFISLKSQLEQINRDYAKYLQPRCESIGYCPDFKCCGHKVTKKIALEFLERVNAVKDEL